MLKYEMRFPTVFIQCNRYKKLSNTIKILKTQKVIHEKQWNWVIFDCLFATPTANFYSSYIVGNRCSGFSLKIWCLGQKFMHWKFSAIESTLKATVTVRSFFKDLSKKEQKREAKKRRVAEAWVSPLVFHPLGKNSGRTQNQDTTEVSSLKLRYISS